MDIRIAHVVQAINNRLDQHIDFAHLAADVNLSSSRLRHLFKQELHLSPAKYVQRVRLERAKALVEDTFLTIKEIAAACGFGDVSHFVRAFEACYGRSPRRHRHQSRGRADEAIAVSR